MKSNLDVLFKTNKKLQEDGVDFVVKEANEEKKIKEVSFRIRRFSQENTRVKAAMAAYYKPHAYQIQMGTLEPEKDREISIKLFLDICLVSWKGVEFDDKEVECTKENAIVLFKRLPEVFDALWQHANDFNNYREELGNS